MSKKILKTAKNKTKGFFSLLVESITYKVKGASERNCE